MTQITQPQTGQTGVLAAPFGRENITPHSRRMKDVKKTWIFAQTAPKAPANHGLGNAKELA